FIPGLGLNILVDVLNAQARYTVYAGPDNNLSDGQLAVYGPDGKYSQAATQILLGSDGSVIAPNTRKAGSGSKRMASASGPARIAIYDSAGKYSQAATRTLLGSAGSITKVRTGDRSAGGKRT